MSHQKQIALCYLGLMTISLSALFVEIPVYIQMMVSTLLTLYIGCHNSLQSQPDQEVEHMSTKDAYMFPVIGSAVLFSLYLVYKYLPAEYVNIVIKVYFFFIGSVALASTLSFAAKAFLPKGVYDSLENKKFQVPLIRVAPSKPETKSETKSEAKSETPSETKSESKEVKPDKQPLRLSMLDILCYFVSGCVGAGYVYTNHWLLSNLFGISFSITGIQLIGLGSTFNGVILLCGLFIYDITWVFGSDVMVTVAKKFDAPVKLLFPRGPSQPPSLLGLGDIVVPGIFVALMLRFDLFLASENAEKKPETFSKPYFTACMIGYFVGLSTTVAVMYAFQHAQPALLYLVPGCLGSVFLLALQRKQFSLWYHYTEEKPEEAKPEAKKD
eukprot:TRINITY_DN312_c0_g1_i2.p1 TRINITY_DN312_c0_g1~~TRINITY_DN312_c0_g1_i2.p1  ORF type:complete len:384 (+),score=87.23 TRINITY_DN312_c0_g1_i2:91-1242(+)